jgi:putative ribosome biogenesis GTPase RsgA
VPEYTVSASRGTNREYGSRTIKETKLALADSQQEAVRVALVSKVLVITGGPGVGKTTLVNSIASSSPIRRL